MNRSTISSYRQRLAQFIAGPRWQVIDRAEYAEMCEKFERWSEIRAVVRHWMSYLVKQELAVRYPADFGNDLYRMYRDLARRFEKFSSEVK